MSRIATTVSSIIPAMPATISGMVAVFLCEVTIGIFFGSLLRLLMDTIVTTGSIIAVQLGLSNAMILNPTLASQSALTSAFLSMAGLVLLFATGLDHMLFIGLIDTYKIFPAGAFLLPGDMVESYATLMTRTFATGVELAAPFLIVGLLLYLVLGFMQKVLPQIQMFLVLLPLQIWGGLFLFSITLSIIMALWLSFFTETFNSMFAQ